MDVERIKLIAFDLDGTLTQHKSPLGDDNRAVLTALSQKYKLLMVGAGMCDRIFRQMGRFPVDILGNYGMQYAEYDAATDELKICENVQLSADRDSVERRVTALREKFGFTEFVGDNVEYHSSGCVTFPILGTRANIEDKLAFDPDRAKRRAVYAQVKAAFPDYTVFVGGSSSFDMVPAPYDKAYALGKYCEEHGLRHDEVAYVGDDYGPGGNDEPVFLQDFCGVKIDDYRTFPQVMKPFL